jgi:hypothetical protein
MRNLDLYEDIKNKIYENTDWEDCDLIVGEPDNYNFPLIELRDSKVKLKYSNEEQFQLTEQMENMFIH